MKTRVNREQLPPGPRMPVVLQMIGFWTRPASSLERLRRKYGKRITVALPFQPPFVMLSDPEEIKELLRASPEAVHPGEGARILEPIVGKHSVILLDESPHLEQRKLLLPAFHGEKMQRLADVMRDLAENEVERWPREQPVALHPRLQRVTLEIILRTVFGLEQGSRLDQLRDLLTSVLSFSESPLSVIPAAQQKLSWFPPVKRLNGLLARTDELIFELIEERRSDGTHERDDVLTLLLEARHDDDSPMSAQELRDELMTALVAGHETTASQLAWTFERLVREPRVLARLRDEVDAGESDEYLTATVHEALRLRPVLPNAEPRLTKQRIRIGEVEYPPGVALLASAYLVHHDPEIYEDPHAFKPERFIGTQPGTYTWLPFGGGRRRCLGASFALLEMKIVLRAVLERYQLEAVGERETTRRRSITFSPSRGAQVVLHERTGRETAAHTRSERAALAA
ncbi:MAG: cytochrome P450 [Solirubrobacterales bacterium]|nr:cytochrome P450 [Solirubrobacterales bacterium]